MICRITYITIFRIREIGRCRDFDLTIRTSALKCRQTARQIASTVSRVLSKKRICRWSCTLADKTPSLYGRRL